jgi:hypothetical protein
MHKPKLILSINTAWNLVNFREGLIRALLSQGYEVVALAQTARVGLHGD